MIEWLANRIFGWTRLREYIFEEVHMHDYINSIMGDPESMKVSSSFYPDNDGYRGWSQNQYTGKYYFNDIPENNVADAIIELEKMETDE
jgi:hypothetical protein